MEHFYISKLSCYYWFRQLNKNPKVISRKHLRMSTQIQPFCPDFHYSDVTMNAMASQITSLTIVYSTVYWGTDQRKHQSSASLAFVWGEFSGGRWITRGKCFHLMTSSCLGGFIVVNGIMTSSNGNILRGTGSLRGEFTGYRWIPITKASDAELWFLFVFV